MSHSDQPNVGLNLLRIHTVITRGIAVIRAQAVRGAVPDDATLAGLVDFTRAFASVLRAHHDGEEGLAFPYFKNVVATAPYDELAAEHRAMEPLIGDVEAAIDRLESGDPPEAALADLNRAAVRMGEAWKPHIGKEEAHFSVATLGRLMEPAEHARLNKALGEFNQQHSGPDYLVVPFILYSLSEQDRAWMSHAMPPVVTEELVPVVWKDKWAPMKPFLLE